MKLCRIVMTLVLLSLSAWAQEGKNQVAFSLGTGLIPSRSTSAGVPVNFSSSIIFSADYARRLTNGNPSLFLEVPFAGEPSNHVQSLDPGSITSLATIFIVPSLRVNFASHNVVSPWLAGGFGYGLSEGSALFGSGGKNTSRYASTGVAQFGGGVDVRTPVKVLFPISLRGEVRDYYSVTNPNFGTPLRGGGQNNVVVSGGFVLHF